MLFDLASPAIELKMTHISDDKTKIDFDLVYEFTTKHSFSKGISRARFDKAMENSWCFGIFKSDGTQVGYCRLITDYATFAMVRDVFVLPQYRGNGYALASLQHVIKKLQDLDIRRVMLGTLDKHRLFEKIGFSLLQHPEYFMEYDHFTNYATQAKW